MTLSERFIDVRSNDRWDGVNAGALQTFGPVVHGLSWVITDMNEVHWFMKRMRTVIKGRTGSVDEMWFWRKCHRVPTPLQGGPPGLLGQGAAGVSAFGAPAVDERCRHPVMLLFGKRGWARHRCCPARDLQRAQIKVGPDVVGVGGAG